MSANLERLGAVLAGRMTETAKGNLKLSAELGTIDGMRALVPDSLGKPIPYGQYLTDERLTLEAGDRVALLWVGSDPVVLATVRAAENPDRQWREITDRQVAEIMGEEE